LFARNINIIIFLIVISLIIFFTWQNNAVGITKHIYRNEKIPKGFDGFKILHISDFHNKNFHGRLTDKIKKINPSVIVITGDLIDRRRTRMHVAVQFIKEIIEIAPVYYVSGNHEQLSDSYSELKYELNKVNVQILDNLYLKLNHDGDEIGLMGLPDPVALQNKKTYSRSNNTKYAESILEKLLNDSDTDFNILLSHRPELFNVYRAMKIDLVFSGHAHGGQIRIPFLGAILSPNQGFFPKYSEGMIVEEETSMVVSRGLGNSLFPLRVFNRPELVVVSLKKDTGRHGDV